MPPATNDQNLSPKGRNPRPNARSLNLNPALSQLPPRESRARRWPGLVALLVVATLFGLVVSNQQNLTDWWRLHDYQSPGSIVKLANQDTMTDQARHLFYLNHPELLDSVNTFRQRCPDSKDTVVLGCYHPVEAGIYIYNVKDPALQGVAQVTAAHETLHAAYSRLSQKDKAQVDRWLNDYYTSGQVSQRVRDEIEIYKKTEPTAVTDEMHSVFGTEEPNLPGPLETYYKRYFSNRGAIVAYQQQYQQEFDTRQATIARDDQQLAVMKQQIDAQESDLSDQQKALQSERAHLDSLLASGNTADYNAAADAYNSQVASYNAGVNNLKGVIAQYNDLVAARNEVAGELTTLDKAIDTRLQTQQ